MRNTLDRTLFTHARIPILLIDPQDGRIVDANAAASDFYGYALPTLKALTIFDINTLSAKQISEEMNHAITTGKAHFLFSHRLADGSLCSVEVHTGPLLVDGRELLYSIIHDISERRKTEAALARSEARLAELAEHQRAILESTNFAVIATNISGIITSINAATEKMLGYSHTELIGKQSPDIFFEPTYLNGPINAQPATFINLIEVNKGKNHESLFLRKGGNAFFVELSLSSMTDLNGKISGYLIVAEDITQRKETEAELRIAATAFQTQEAMFITDTNNIILRVNRAFTDVTGYSSEEAVGKKPTLLQSGRQSPNFYRSLWKKLLQNNFWQGEIYNKRKNGEIFPEWLNITAVKDSHGETSHYVASFTDITEYKQREEAIHNLAYYDPLTQLPNRRLLLDRIKQTMLSNTRHDKYGALLLIDLDNFKKLNDTQGHDVGDLLLIEVAQRILGQLRSEDTVARLGGDEFVVMLNDLDSRLEVAAQNTEIVAEKIRNAINKPFLLRGHEYHNSPSIGISIFHNQEISVDKLLKHADTAMYQAKHSGRNTIRFFDPATQAAMESRVQLEVMLREAIPAQLKLYYQPQIDKDGHINGAEVLLRWIHPEKGMISPAEFIPLAEDSGLILPIGDWVMDTACSQLKQWENNTITQHLHLAVNVSAKQFRQADFVDNVLAILQKTGAPPQKLKLELTESLLIDDIDGVVNKMTALKAIGVSFSLDDFGTGFSSLSYLKTLPLDQLKIDQSFVRDILTDPNDAAIARTVIALAQSLGLGVIAEGVETELQRGFLSTHGCDNYQGYLFGRPMPLADFEHHCQNYAR